MRPRLEIDFRHLPGGGWEWTVLTFVPGRMVPRVRGRAPYRWMARIDAWRYVRRNRALLAYDGRPSWDDIDLR